MAVIWNSKSNFYRKKEKSRDIEIIDKIEIKDFMKNLKIEYFG